ncbi:sigma-70 region 4 domain-containing protein [Spirillospora sp. NPDC052269]
MAQDDAGFAEFYRRAVVALRGLRRHGLPPDVQPPDESSVDLVTALADLPEPQRRALVMHHMGGYTVREIAALEGVAEGTVKARLSRGRTRLAAVISVAVLAIAVVVGARIVGRDERPVAVAPGLRPLGAADLWRGSSAAEVARNWTENASPSPSVPGCGGADPDFSRTAQRLTLTDKGRRLDAQGGELHQAQFFVFPTLRAARQAMDVLGVRARACGPGLRISRPGIGEDALSLEQSGPALESYRAVVVRQGTAVLVFSDHRRGGFVLHMDYVMLDEPARDAADHLRGLGYRG